MPSLLRLGAILLAIVAAAVWVAASPALAEKRVALVIGNDVYSNLPSLQKAVNDAEAVGDALGKLGFDVVRGRNLGRQGMIDKLAEFTAKIAPGDIALFFYAGHGVAINNVNYLVPVDVPSANAEARVRGGSIAEGDIVAEIQAKGARVAMLVLDACRDNPFPRAGTRSVGNARGLASTTPASGVFVLYSAGAGQTALDRLRKDDPHRNGVFTRVFVEHLTKPGLHLGDLAVEVREQVAVLARQSLDDQGRPAPHVQTPAYYDQTIGGRVYLAGRGIAVEPRPVAPDVSALQERLKALEDQLRKGGETSKDRSRNDESKRDDPKKDEPKVTVLAPQPMLGVPAESRVKPAAGVDPSPSKNDATPSLTNTSLEARAREFLEDYMRRSQGEPSAYFAFLQQVFAPVVVYYGKSATRDAVVAEQRRHVERWPKRSFRLKSETIKIACDFAESTCRVSGDLDYRNENPSRSQVASGTWHYEFRLVLSGSTPVITEESGNTISRAVGKAR